MKNLKSVFEEVNKSLFEEELPALYQHQQQAINTTDITDSALIIRGAGSGKTRIGIEIVKKNITENNFILWICPASLISQAMKDFDNAEIPNYKFISKDRTINKGSVIFVSYDLLKRNISLFTSKSWDLIICDEFHRTRNVKTITNQSVWKVRKKANKFYALTATPFNNDDKDFFQILSIVANKNIVNKLKKSIYFKEKKSDFAFKIYEFFMVKIFGKKPEKNEVKAKVINKRTINKIIDQYIDYVNPDEYIDKIKRPTSNSKIQKIEMYPEEVEEYSKIHKNKLIRNDQMAYRVLLLKENSSKIDTAVKKIRELSRNKNKKIIVFSNFVENGLENLAKRLKAKDIKYALYTGSVDKKEKNEIKDSFVNGKLNVMLISPSGFEGIDLKGTTDCIVLDPHYNPSKTEQIISRGLRAGSEVKTVNIIQYCSISERLNFPTVDERIMEISNYKKETNDAMENLIKQINYKKNK